MFLAQDMKRTTYREKSALLFQKGLTGYYMAFNVYEKNSLVSIFNPIPGGGGLFGPRPDSNCNNFLTSAGMNLKF